MSFIYHEAGGLYSPFGPCDFRVNFCAKTVQPACLVRPAAVRVETDRRRASLRP